MQNVARLRPCLFLVIVVAILRSALFADRRISGVVGSRGAARTVHRSFGAKGRRLRMTVCWEWCGATAIACDGVLIVENCWGSLLRGGAGEPAPEWGATTGLKARCDFTRFTRPSKGRSSTVLHTFVLSFGESWSCERYSSFRRGRR